MQTRIYVCVYATFTCVLTCMRACFVCVSEYSLSGEGLPQELLSFDLFSAPSFPKVQCLGDFILQFSVHFSLPIRFQLPPFRKFGASMLDCYVLVQGYFSTCAGRPFSALSSNFSLMLSSFSKRSFRPSASFSTATCTRTRIIARGRADALKCKCTARYRR
jgi:hypothetical protein